ncbi:MAG TPA: ABC transporter ATP-binding protein [Candidatus Mediterraneibacter quadrami]|uniref:ABC transporter ATP-binding protein n=1 Tax=Candidatus Mediterraneibacter quadrami TaxID=2838684 RepID=A0A9D2RAL2_9FIRM|nr:ABC transporter ATP-binding protein [Candidatus Mediterraneibacter quadrami]
MLEIKDLVKKYGDFRLECSLQVKPGQITGLIGENGSGKSTTFKSILGLIRPDSGTIRIFGKERSGLDQTNRQQIAAVLSDSGFSGYLTIRDIIPILAHMYRHFDREYFQHQVKRFDLPENKMVKEFSTGMKAKLKLLAALGSRAKLFIMDEPTSGLDVVARDELLDLIREYMAENEDSSVLISSHISADLESLCDDVYMIHEGKIVLHEDMDTLLSDYGILKVDEKQYADMDKQYMIRTMHEAFGYACMTDQKQYYMENYPGAVLEKGSLDSVITMMIRGDEL